MSKLPVGDRLAVQRYGFDILVLLREVLGDNSKLSTSNPQLRACNLRCADDVLPSARVERLESHCREQIPRAHQPAIFVAAESVWLWKVELVKHLGKKCFAFSSLDKSNIPDILAKM